MKFAVLDAYVAYHVNAARTEFPKTGRYQRTDSQPTAPYIPGLGMTRAETAIAQVGSASDDPFDEEKAKMDAFRHFEGAWMRWVKLSTFRRLSADQTDGIDWRKADGTKDHPVWASVSFEADPSEYDLIVLLALIPMNVYKSIISSGLAEAEYGRLPWLALSVLGGQTSNAAAEGCHSIAQLMMSDLQTSIGDDILQMIVCLRDSKVAVERLKAIYPEEAKHVALDITAQLGELAAQQPERASVQQPKPNVPVVVESSSDPSSTGDGSD